MQKTLILFLILVASKLGAQTGEIRGKLYDSVGRETFENSSVLLLNAESNQLISYTRANKIGEFVFGKLPAGTYKVVASSVGFADLTDYVVLQANEHKYMGMLPMFDQVQVMEAIIIRRRAAIEMRGDTLTYAADSFKTFEGATVEDLLRKLPGVQVDRNGKITAQGKTVDRVLVDGEEFFGNDATVATRNLNAKNVDAVKVYDAQTDDAVAAGDGEKLKIMDIRLKDNAKQGWVGKITAGGALSAVKNLYDGKVFLNHFNKKERFGIYGISANSPELNLNWQDRREFTTSINSDFGEDGILFSTFTGSEFDYWLGYSQGLPTGNQANGFYQNKWNNDKFSLNANFGYKDLTLYTKTNNRSTNLLNNAVLLNNNDNVVDNAKSKAEFNISTEIALDTFTTLGIGLNASQNQLNNSENKTYSSLRNDDKVNDQTTYSNVLGTSNSQEFKTYLRKKFSDKRKYLRIQANYGSKQNQDSTHFESYVNTYGGGNTNSQSWKQNKLFEGKLSSLSGSINFKLPLNKKWVLDLSNNSSLETQNSEKYTRNVAASDYIDTLSSLSKYQKVRFTNAVKALYTHGKTTWGIGASHNLINLHQTESIRNINYTRGPINTITPVLSLNYKYATSGRFSASYEANTILPSLNQIQPIIDNINPIILVKGNPNLKNALTHQLILNLHDGKTFTNRWIWLNGWANYTQDAFVNSSSYDSFGRSVRQTLNRDGNYGFGINSYYYKSIKSYLSVKLGYNPRFNNFANMVNGLTNITKQWTHGINPSIDLDFEKYGLELEYTINFNSSKSSLNTEFNNKNITQVWNLQLFYENPKIMDINLSFEQNIRPTTNVFKNQSNNLIVNANVARTLDKKKNFEIEIGVFDLLNQNIGYTRNVYENQITENSFNTFTQFYYARLTYKFNKLNSNKKKEETK